MYPHENALLFSMRKKLTLSGTKCFNMVLNQDQNNQPISLPIDSNKKVLVADEITYLGDVFMISHLRSGTFLSVLRLV